jgi:peptide chain release factor 2
MARMQDPRVLEQFSVRVDALRTLLRTIEELVDPAGTAERVAQLAEEMASDGFWNDTTNAAKVGAEHTRLTRKLEGLDALREELENAETALELARDAEGSDLDELVVDLEDTVGPLADKLARLQEESLFSGEYDGGPAIVSIHSGEGGVDAQDWTQMLQRMYFRFLERRGMKPVVEDETPGEQAGIKSTSFIVRGENAYGVMNAESGVHRLVRLSPFDSAHRRQTSFAQVEVTPLFDDDVEIDIDKKDIREDTYRASGAGGQHVNKTSSAIRLTHIPTGVVVQCQNERSQHQNRDTALKMLAGKLYELERQKRESVISAEKGEAQNVGFGSQIRSYVLQPYQMVKDLRTRHETGNVQAVLDGDLDEFIRSFLLHKAQGGSSFRVDPADLDD